MALAKQIQQFRLQVSDKVLEGSGSSATDDFDLNTQNMDFRWEIERFTDADVALDGTVLSDNTIAGRRLYVDIRYDQNIEPTTWDNMTNQVIGDSIYFNSASYKFYPDASATGSSIVLNVTGTDVSSNVITAGAHGLTSGQFVEVSSTNITGLTAGNFYYVDVASAGSFSLSSVINGTVETLTDATGTANIQLQEKRFVEMAIDNIDELQAYQNTISSFRPSIRLKSLKRFVTIPSVFYNV